MSSFPIQPPNSPVGERPLKAHVLYWASCFQPSYWLTFQLPLPAMLRASCWQSDTQGESFLNSGAKVDAKH